MNWPILYGLSILYGHRFWLMTSSFIGPEETYWSWLARFSFFDRILALADKSKNVFRKPVKLCFSLHQKKKSGRIKEKESGRIKEEESSQFLESLLESLEVQEIGWFLERVNRRNSEERGGVWRKTRANSFDWTCQWRKLPFRANDWTSLLSFYGNSWKSRKFRLIRLNHNIFGRC